MPFDRRDLIGAVTIGNLELVQEILGETGPDGIPVIDLNNGFGNVGTALLWAVCARPVNELIVQALLNVRDNDNNLVLNVNHEGPHGQTALSFILNRNTEPALRRRLLQRVLDVRGALGERIIDVANDHANIPLLKQACDMGDLHCLRMLMDLREADGTFSLDINEVRHRTTVLDIAERGMIGHDPDPHIIAAIRDSGGMAGNDAGTFKTNLGP